MRFEAAPGQTKTSLVKQVDIGPICNVRIAEYSADWSTQRATFYVFFIFCFSSLFGVQDVMYCSIMFYR